MSADLVVYNIDITTYRYVIRMTDHLFLFLVVCVFQIEQAITAFCNSSTNTDTLVDCICRISI